MWGSRDIAPPFLTSVLDGGEWSASHPSHFTPGDTASSTHWTGSWVGARGSPDAVQYRIISCPSQELNPGHPSHELSWLNHQILLIKHHTMKTYGGAEIQLQIFLAFALSWALSFMLSLLYSWRKRVGLRTSMCCREEKNLHHCRKLNPSSLVDQPIAFSLHWLSYPRSLIAL
jgi:hypothetical protein